MVVAPVFGALDHYDAAHRPTDLRDGIGNTIHFTLANMGNVTHQEMRGRAADLVAQAQRTYDDRTADPKSS